MRTIRHSMTHDVPLVGIELMLAGLFGDPAVSAADMELSAYQNDRGAQRPYEYQNPWGQQDYRRPRDPWGPQDRWGYRHDRPSRGRGLPDHYTIRKGKKCEVQCTRIRGTREYKCREYRC